MLPVEFSADLFPQLEAISCCMKDAQFVSQADIALTMLALRRLYQSESPRHFDSIQALQVKNPSWITIEFLKNTPPSHICHDRLEKLFDIASRVYLATNQRICTPAAIPEDTSNELACWLYEITKQIEVYEARQSALASVAKGVIGAAGITGLVSIVSPWLAPIGLAAGYIIKRLSSSELTLQDRRRLKPVEYIDINNSVRYMFEPESSGLYGRHVQKIQSYTLGELEIDVNGEAFSCFFNLNSKHKISPSDVSRLHFAMLRRLTQTSIDPARCMSILEALETKELSRGSSYPPVAAFLDPQLALCLDALKQRCKKLIEASNHLASLPRPALQGTIIDVSGYKNGCGLYALAVAAIKAYKGAKSPHNTQLPEYLLDWKEEWLGRVQLNGYTRLDQLHTILREALADALVEDAVFKADNTGNFISACLNVLSGQRYPAEMRAFFESNELFIATLSEITSNTAYKLTAEERAQDERRLQSKGTLITPDDICRMQRILRESQETLNKEAPHFEAILDTFFQSTLDPLDRIIQQRKLYLVTCMSCPTLEQRQRWRSEAERWLEAKLAACMLTASEEQKIPLIKLFGFLSSTNFEGQANTYTLPLFDDIIDTETLRLVVANHVHAAWPDLFANYVQFIKCENCMLTADELLVLAKKWNLDLSILEWGSKHEALPTLPGQLKIYLTNPSKIHWQAFDAVKI